MVDLPDTEVLIRDVVLDVLNNCHTSDALALGACLRFVRTEERELEKSIDCSSYILLALRHDDMMHYGRPRKKKKAEVQLFTYLG